MNGLTVRTAGPDDSEFAYGTRKAATKKYWDKIQPWDEAEERRVHDRRFGSQDFRVVSVDGTDVGIMALVVEPECVMLHQLFLLPEHQGKGVGRECVRLVMDEARRVGLPLRLRVLKVNPRARSFYDRLGFARTSETNIHDLMEWGQMPTQSRQSSGARPH